MCGHGGECTMNVWVLSDNGKKTPGSFSIDGYQPETNTLYQFQVVTKMDINVQRTVQKDESWGITICVRSAGL